MKMIVTDLDGTLLNKESKVTEKTKNYLTKLKESGMIIVIATGRCLKDALYATDDAKFANYVIADSGSTIYNLEERKILFKKAIKPKTIKNIRKTLEPILESIEVFGNRKGQYPNQPIEQIEKITEVTHLSIYVKNKIEIEQGYKILKKEFPSLQILKMQDSFSSTKSLEITPKHCTKYKSIQKLSQMLKIKKRDIMVFGDGLNDLEMITKCGRGIAMKNALPMMKWMAKDITDKDNTEDGVVDYLKKRKIVGEKK